MERSGFVQICSSQKISIDQSTVKVGAQSIWSQCRKVHWLLLPLLVMFSLSIYQKHNYLDCLSVSPQHIPHDQHSTFFYSPLGFYLQTFLSISYSVCSFSPSPWTFLSHFSASVCGWMETTGKPLSFKICWLCKVKDRRERAVLLFQMQ